MAEFGHRLIYGEAGNIRRDLKQHSARFAKIQRPEVVSVLLLGRLDAVVLGEFLHHRELSCVVGRPEGNVVHRARPLTATQEIPHCLDVDDAAYACPAGPVPDNRAFPSFLREAEHIG